MLALWLLFSRTGCHEDRQALIPVHDAKFVVQAAGFYFRCSLASPFSSFQLARVHKLICHLDAAQGLVLYPVDGASVTWHVWDGMTVAQMYHRCCHVQVICHIPGLGNECYSTVSGFFYCILATTPAMTMPPTTTPTAVCKFCFGYLQIII